MKKVILILVIFLSFINANAQDIIDSSAKEICNCANERIKAIDNVGNNQKETFLFICTTSIFNKNTNAVLKEYGLDALIEGTLDRFTKDVNEKLEKICPNILPTNVQNQQTNTVPETVVNDENIVPIKCTVVNIITNQYPTIEAKDKNGVLYSFIIFKPFPTDSLFNLGGIKLGNNIIVTYENQSIYDNTISDFRIFKTITQLEKVK